jgi:hypothetical protein
MLQTTGINTTFTDSLTGTPVMMSHVKLACASSMLVCTSSYSLLTRSSYEQHGSQHLLCGWSANPAVARMQGTCYAPAIIPSCTGNGEVQLIFGSAPYVGLGALVFAMLVFIELFG